MKREGQLFCPIRRQWVADLPEERVRLLLIHSMVADLGYPLQYLSVEKALCSLPHLASVSRLPRRRIDLLCFGKELHSVYPLWPLLLVECKAVPLTAKVINQAVGYNRYVQAYFVAVANQNEVRVGAYLEEEGGYRFFSGMPPFSFLMSRLSV